MLERTSQREIDYIKYELHIIDELAAAPTRYIKRGNYDYVYNSSYIRLVEIYISLIDYNKMGQSTEYWNFHNRFSPVAEYLEL